MRTLHQYLVCLSLTLLALLCGCQRWHTESVQGPKAKIQPPYDDNLKKPDPNLPGDAQ